MFENFCGSKFWSFNITKNSTDEDFTVCFQDTVLVWLPCGFLIFFSIFYFCFLRKTFDIGNTWLNLIKTVISVLLTLLSLVDVFWASKEYSSGLHPFVAHILAPCITCLAMGMSVVVIQFGRRRGERVCGFLFIYWTLQTAAGVVGFQSRLRTHLKVGDVYHLTYSSIFLILVLLQLILSGFIVDTWKRAYDPQLNMKNICPEVNASFMSRLTFWWFTRLVTKGYKKSLEQSDLWSLDPELSSGHVVLKFEKRWSREVKKYLRALEKQRKKEQSAEENYLKEENKALLADKDQGRVKMDKDQVETGKDQVVIEMDQVKIDIAEVPATSFKVRKTKVHRPSLWLALGRAFGVSFIFGSFLKLNHDILIFISPMLLQAILRFVKSPNAPHWEGYMYAGLIFSVAFIQSMVLHQYFHRCMVVGMNVRTCLIGAIYKKSLKLGNQARKKSTVGEIVNLMSADAQRFMELTTYLNMLWSAPFQICVSLYMLWNILGPAVLSGVAVMILLIPVNAFIAKKNKAFQVKQMKLKDTRIKLMSEILNGVKVLKLYAWEPSFKKKVLDIRHKELVILRKMSYLSAVSSFLWNCSPFMVSLASFATYVLSSSSNVLDAEKAFVSLSLFNILRFPLSMLPHLIANMVQTSVSVKRLEMFFINEELDEDSVKHVESVEGPAVNIENGAFAWELNPEKPVVDDVNLKIEKGTLVGIVGQVGSGKSTLLSAMLGEAERLNGSVTVDGSIAFVAQQAWMQNATVESNVLFGESMKRDRYEEVIEACALKPDLDLLPARDETEIGEKGINLSGGQKQRISLARAVYANADVYLLDDTLSAVDSHVGKHIFDKVLGRKGLLKDKTRILVTHGLKFLPEFDTIVVLVGGKISEVGSYAQLLKKKGEFAKFLDAHIKQEVEKGQSMDEDEINLRERILSTIGGDSEEIKKKITRLRKDTNRSESPVTTPVLPRSMPGSPRLEITLEHKGEGDNDVFDTNNQKLHRTLSQNSKKTVNSISHDKKEEIPLVKSNDNKRIITEEKMETGNVKLSVFLAYLKALTMTVTVGVVICYLLQMAFNIGVSFWLSHWSNDIAEEYVRARSLVTDVANVTFGPQAVHDESKVKMRLTVYGLLGLAQSLAVLLGAYLLARGALRASFKLHKGILDRGLRAPMSFFESTPTGRIINRFAKDIDVIDTTLPANFDVFSKCTLAVFGTLFVISFNTPIFIVVVIPLSVIYFFVQRFYIKTSRQLKRLESVSRSPIFSHFGETVQGASTIRAYKQLDRFVGESERRVDENLVSYYPGIASNRWLAVRLEFVGNCLVFFSTLFSILGKDNLTPGMVGLSITYALNITQTLNWMVRMSGEVETNVVAVERIKEYSETETEAEWVIDSKRPPSDWPGEGKLEFRNYSLTYRSGLEPVLKDITCTLKSGEKVGIAGRTGAGKSSLTMGLFRILEPCGGSILIDDIDISTIGLHDLRSKLTIIPQDPVLFSGTLRMNLDPFDLQTEEEIWNSLKYAHLEEFVRSLPDGLSHQCGEGGVNLSVGQRQLLCLARALLRRTRILVLDEATAAVDVNTDKLIQSTIETHFKHCTILTIAHRINTIIDYDRVLVLDYGRLVELDSPQVLVGRKDSYFHGLAKEDGLI